MFAAIIVYNLLQLIIGSSLGLATVILGLCSVINGLIASRLYKLFNQTQWIALTIISALLLPFQQIFVLLLINYVAPSYMLS